MAQAKVIGKASKVGQTAQLKRLPNGRTVADARTPTKAAPIAPAKPQGKAAPVLPKGKEVSQVTAPHGCLMRGCREVLQTAGQLVIHMRKVHGMQAAPVAPVSNGKVPVKPQGKAAPVLPSKPVKVAPITADQLKVGDKVRGTYGWQPDIYTVDCIVVRAYKPGEGGIEFPAVYLEGTSGKNPRIAHGLYYSKDLIRHKVVMLPKVR